MAALRVEDVVVEPDVPADPHDAASPRLPAGASAWAAPRLRHADEDASAFLIRAAGRGARGLADAREDHERARVPPRRPVGEHPARGADRPGGQPHPQGARQDGGLDPMLYYPPTGLRSGFLTEAARQGVPLPEAMAQSQHKSVQQAARYYNDAERRMGKAARLLG